MMPLIYKYIPKDYRVYQNTDGTYTLLHNEGYYITDAYIMVDKCYIYKVENFPNITQLFAWIKDEGEYLL